MLQCKELLWQCYIWKSHVYIGVKMVFKFVKRSHLIPFGTVAKMKLLQVHSVPTYIVLMIYVVLM